MLSFHKDASSNCQIIISLQAKESYEGTQCQQAILILSDGSASYEEEIFKTYNADKKVISCAMIQEPIFSSTFFLL